MPLSPFSQSGVVVCRDNVYHVSVDVIMSRHVKAVLDDCLYMVQAMSRIKMHIAGQNLCLHILPYVGIYHFIICS